MSASSCQQRTRVERAAGRVNVMASLTSPIAILMAIASALAACKSIEQPSMARSKGATVLVRFANGQPAVEGTLLLRKHGVWRSWYANGRGFVVGAYDERGKCIGVWAAFEKNGARNTDRSGLHCDSLAIGVSNAALDKWDWSRLPGDALEYRRYLPNSSEGWDGSGYYRAGRYERPLREDEWRQASLAFSD